MGNTISYKNDGTIQPVLELAANGDVVSTHTNNLLRRHIQNVLMNRNVNVNGNAVDINKLKVFCRRNPTTGSAANSVEPIGNLQATGTDDFISLSLPYVTNTAPNFSLSDEPNSNNINMNTTIKTAYVPFNYHNSSEVINIKTDFDTERPFESNDCKSYIGAVCGKQILDNKCVINTSTDSSAYILGIDPNNKKCFKDKTEEKQLLDVTKRKYNNEQKTQILKNISDMGKDSTGALISRPLDVTTLSALTQTHFADYIGQYSYLLDFIKIPWNHYRYSHRGDTPSGTPSGYSSEQLVGSIDISLTANQAGEKVWVIPSDATQEPEWAFPNTAEGNTIGHIYLKNDFYNYENWNTNTSTYFQNQQNINNLIFTTSDFLNYKFLAADVIPAGKVVGDYSDGSTTTYHVLPRLASHTQGSSTVSGLQDISSNQDLQINCYLNIRRMVILNFIYSNETIVKPSGSSGKTFNTGEPLCNCVNSPYGPNFQTEPTNKCLGELSGLTVDTLISIADGSPSTAIEQAGTTITWTESKAEEARKCLGWNVKNLTNYRWNDTTFVQQSGIRGKAMKYREAKNMRTSGRGNGSATIGPILTIIQGLSISQQERNLLSEQVNQVYARNTQNVQKVNITASNQRDKIYTIHGYGKSTATVSDHNYSVQLDAGTYDVGNLADTGGSNRDYWVSAKVKDNVCKNSHTLEDATPHEQKPYFHSSNSQPQGVTCVNNISFNNIAVDTLNIGSILQNNTCGNVGDIQQTFISVIPGETTNRSQCPGDAFANVIYLTGFTQKVITDGGIKIVYSIGSNLNGAYYYDQRLSNLNKTDQSLPSPFQVFKNAFDESIILVINTDFDSSTVRAKIYKDALGTQTLILETRIFNYRSDNSDQNEEMCIDKVNTSLGLLFRDLTAKKNSSMEADGREIPGMGGYIYNSGEASSLNNSKSIRVFNNFKVDTSMDGSNILRGTQYNLATDALNMSRFINDNLSTGSGSTARIPNYTWNSEVPIVNNGGGSQSFEKFVQQKNGIIVTGMTDNRRSSSQTYFTGNGSSATRVDDGFTLYLEETTNNVRNGINNSMLDPNSTNNDRYAKAIYGITKIYQENQNNIEAFGIITDVNNDEPNTGVLNWANVSRDYFDEVNMNINGAIKSTHRINFSSNRFLAGNTSFIIYNAALARYLLVYKSRTEFTIIGASNVTNQSLKRLAPPSLSDQDDKDFNDKTPGPNTIEFTSANLDELPLSLFNTTRTNEKNMFFEWHGHVFNVEQVGERPVNRSWILRNFDYYHNHMGVIKDLEKVPDTVSFQLVSNAHQPGNLQNTSDVQTKFNTLQAAPIYNPSNNSFDPQLRFALDLYGEMSLPTSSRTKSSTQTIIGMKFKRKIAGSKLYKYVFEQLVNSSDSVSRTVNNNVVFTFENGTWVLIRPRNTVQTFTNVVENMTSSTGPSSTPSASPSSHISISDNNVRLFFNRRDITQGNTSVIDLPFQGSLLQTQGFKVITVPTSQFYLEFCYNMFGSDDGNKKVRIVNSEGANIGSTPDLEQSPWYKALVRCGRKNPTRFGTVTGDNIDNTIPNKEQFLTVLNELIVDKISNYFSVNNISITNSTNLIFEEAINKHSSLLTDDLLRTDNSNDGWGNASYILHNGAVYRSLNASKSPAASEFVTVDPIMKRFIIKIETSASADELYNLNLHSLVGHINDSLPVVDMDNLRILKQFLLKIGVVTHTNYVYSKKPISVGDNNKIYSKENTASPGQSSNGNIGYLEGKYCDNTSWTENVTGTCTNTIDSDKVDLLTIESSMFKGRNRNTNHLSFMITNMNDCSVGMLPGNLVIETTFPFSSQLSLDDKKLFVKRKVDEALRSTVSGFGCVINDVTSTTKSAPATKATFTNTNKIEGFTNFNSFGNYELFNNSNINKKEIIENIDNTSSNYRKYEIKYLYFIHPDEYYPALPGIANSAMNNNTLNRAIGPLNNSYTNLIQRDVTSTSNTDDNAYSLQNKHFLRSLAVGLNNGLANFSANSGNLKVSTFRIDNTGTRNDYPFYDTSTDPFLETIETLSLGSQLNKIEITFNQLKNSIIAFRDAITTVVERKNKYSRNTYSGKFTNSSLNTDILQFFQNTTSPNDESEGIINIADRNFNLFKGTVTDGLLAVLRREATVTSWAQAKTNDYTVPEETTIRNSTEYIQFFACIELIKNNISRRGLQFDNGLNITVTNQGPLSTLFNEYYYSKNMSYFDTTYNFNISNTLLAQAESNCSVDYNTESPNDSNTCATFEKLMLQEQIDIILTEIAQKNGTTTVPTYNCSEIGSCRTYYREKRQELDNLIITQKQVVEEEILEEEQSAKRSKIIRIIIAVILFLLIAAGVFFYLKNKSSISAGTSADADLEMDYEDYDYGEEE